MNWTNFKSLHLKCIQSSLLGRPSSSNTSGWQRLILLFGIIQLESLIFSIWPVSKRLIGLLVRTDCFLFISLFAIHSRIQRNSLKSLKSIMKTWTIFANWRKANNTLSFILKWFHQCKWHSIEGLVASRRINKSSWMSSTSNHLGRVYITFWNVKIWLLNIW
jgi:hypothetical protein